VEWLESSSNAPQYLTVDKSKITASLVRVPDQQEIPVQVNIQLVVEFYNRLT
jgi:small subunit ribosomal protein S4